MKEQKKVKLMKKLSNDLEQIWSKSREEKFNHGFLKKLGRGELQEKSVAKVETQETELSHLLLEKMSNGQRSTAVCLQEGN